MENTIDVKGALDAVPNTAAIPAIAKAAGDAESSGKCDVIKEPMIKPKVSPIIKRGASVPPEVWEPIQRTQTTALAIIIISSRFKEN